MKPKTKRFTASEVRKKYPGLLRITLPEGRRWTIGTSTTYISLADVMTHAHASAHPGEGVSSEKGPEILPVSDEAAGVAEADGGTDEPS